MEPLKLEQLGVALQNRVLNGMTDVKGQSYSHLHRKMYDINVLLDQLAHP